MDLPEDWARFSLPPALDARLTALLDQRDQAGGLLEAEQRGKKKGKKKCPTRMALTLGLSTIYGLQAFLLALSVLQANKTCIF